MLLVFYLILILLVFYPSYKILSKLIAKRSQEGSVGLMSKMEGAQMDKMCGMLSSNRMTSSHNPDLSSRLCINLL